MFLQVKGSMQIIVKFRTEKYLCIFLSSNTKYPLEEHTLNIVHQILCSSTLKWNELIVYISLKESKLVCFTNNYLQITFSFQVHDLVRAEKRITRHKFLHCGGACMYKKSKSQQKRYTIKFVCQNFQFFQHLKITFMCACGFYNRYEHV